jgi:hypothetical protein
MDGPVVKAARRALEAKDVDLVLPYVFKGGEDEVKRAFDKVLAVRSNDGPLTAEIADLYFFETVVRVHRQGENAPYTGLKPAGLDVGPVIPVAQRAIEAGSPDELIDTMTHRLRGEIGRRFDRMMLLRERASRGVDEAREYVEAMLGLQIYCHSLYESMQAEPHEASHASSPSGHASGHTSGHASHTHS